MAPPKGKGKQKVTKQVTLARANVLPMLSKPATAIGKECHVPGDFWEKCHEGDKEKIFKCTVLEFDAMHTFDRGIKSAAFEVKEMGESGEGSLEMGVASGDVFYIAYPMPFLKYFYAANPADLPEHMQSSHTPPVESGGEVTAVVTTKKDKEDPLILQHLDGPVSSTLNVSGSKRGCYTNKYTCNVIKDNGQVCGSKITVYKSAEGNSYSTSNAWSHIRDAAKLDAAHKAILTGLDVNNPKRVQDQDGNWVAVMDFKEAFPHHVRYVYCRAQGIIGANTAKKPEFRQYVRGMLCCPPLYFFACDSVSLEHVTTH